MKFILSLLMLFTFKAQAFHFVEVDALNPIFYGINTSHSLRTDVRFGRDMGDWDVALRYANEIGVPADTDGTGIEGKDGSAHHLGLRAAYKASSQVRVGGGYIYSMFSADQKFNGQKKTMNESLSGFEAFVSYQWDFSQWFIRSEVSYHHIFGNLKQEGAGGFAEYDIGQGKLSALIGYQF